MGTLKKLVQWSMVLYFVCGYSLTLVAMLVLYWMFNTWTYSLVAAGWVTAGLVIKQSRRLWWPSAKLMQPEPPTRGLSPWEQSIVGLFDGMWAMFWVVPAVKEFHHWDWHLPF